MAVKARNLRRLIEAAARDKTPDRPAREIREALASGELKPEEFSIRDLFRELVPDGGELLEYFNPRHPQYDEFNLTALVESNAVNTTAFSNITGQIVYSKIHQGFTAEAFVLSGLVDTVPTQFSGEKIAGMTRLGDVAEPIGEGQPYPTAGFGEDWIETPETQKRGFIVPVTKESIFFDRTGLILRRASEVGEYLGLNKEKRLIDCVIDENAVHHRYKWRGVTYATYQASAPWANIATSNALDDWTDIDAAELKLAQIVDPYTGEPVLISAKHLLVPYSLGSTANRILNATEVRHGDITSGDGIQTLGANPVRGKYQIVTSRLFESRLATKTNWFLGDITKAFAYMENFPLQVSKAPVNSELEFSNDIVARFKASERGTAATMEPRCMVKNTQ